MASRTVGGCPSLSFGVGEDKRGLFESGGSCPRREGARFTGEEFGGVLIPARRKKVVVNFRTPVAGREHLLRKQLYFEEIDGSDYYMIIL